MLIYKEPCLIHRCNKVQAFQVYFSWQVNYKGEEKKWVKKQIVIDLNVNFLLFLSKHFNSNFFIKIMVD